MSYFTEYQNVRFRTKEMEALKKLVAEHPDKYETVSHAIRCAVIKLLNE